MPDALPETETDLLYNLCSNLTERHHTHCTHYETYITLSVNCIHTLLTFPQEAFQRQCKQKGREAVQKATITLMEPENTEILL